MMRNTNLSNTLSMFIALSTVVAAGTCGCADHIVVGNQDLLDAGTETARDPDATTDTPPVDVDTTRTKVAPFAIGCNDSHELTPAVNPSFTSRRAVPDANACVLAVDSAASLVTACASADP